MKFSLAHYAIFGLSFFKEEIINPIEVEYGKLFELNREHHHSDRFVKIKQNAKKNKNKKGYLWQLVSQTLE